jgi:hypothetical protein
LVSAFAILLLVAAFAAVFLSVHTAHVSVTELEMHRLRAEAAGMAATQLTLWRLTTDADQQDPIARVVYEHDTSFTTTPLFQTDGSLAGATFHVDLWPGEDTVRLKTVASCHGAYFQRWAQMPIRLAPATELLACGDFETRSLVVGGTTWRGRNSLGRWMAGNGIAKRDDPRHRTANKPWNRTLVGSNHFVEELRSTSIMAQYVNAQGADGTLSLDFDYIHSNGGLTVRVRGVNTLPANGTLTVGSQAYQRWADAGVVLYDSGNLTQSAGWSHLQVNVNAGTGYAYYVVQVEAVGAASGTPPTPERAIDNVSLKGSL